jgi:hypothetical protein
VFGVGEGGCVRDGLILCDLGSWKCGGLTLIWAVDLQKATRYLLTGTRNAVSVFFQFLHGAVVSVL